jgi:hypothetical protein
MATNSTVFGLNFVNIGKLTAHTVCIKNRSMPIKRFEITLRQYELNEVV